MFFCARNETHFRKQTGSLGTLLMAIGILIAVGLGSFAVDFAHVQAVRTQLQSATDAAALAGAQDLYTNLANAATHALQLAAANTADGRAVSNQSPGTTVAIQVTPPDPINDGQVEVTAQMNIRHLLASIFGRNSDTIYSRSVAGRSSTLRRLNSGQGFPLAVSYWAPPGPGGLPLSSLEPGDTIELTINSQQFKNAAWTSLTIQPANDHYVSQAIDQLLGLTNDVPGFIPSVELGDTIFLMNGIGSHMELGRDTASHSALLAEPLLVMPVVENLPPMNQTGDVMGFIAVDVTGVTLSQRGGEVLTITGVLVRASVRGDDCPACDTGVDNTSLGELAVGPVKLIE
ncbi:MAG: hypothetical protein HY711_01255 [Candidatus Melainabacteria bacterium]|nr:hypothetical protein [Candidatus Melainabacteria bacterium]